MSSQTTQWTLSMFMQISNMRTVRNTLSACANFPHGCRNSRTLCRYIRVYVRAGAPNFREIYVALLLSNRDSESYQPKEENKLSGIYFISQRFFFNSRSSSSILIKLSEASWISKTNIHVFSFLTDVTFLSKLPLIDSISLFFCFAFKITKFL